MTLHEAISEILLAPGKPMPATAIADEINRLGTYSRRDGTPVPPNQIWARVCVKRYRHIFACSPGLIDLRGRQ